MSLLRFKFAIAKTRFLKAASKIISFIATNYTFKARFKRRILHATNAIQTMHNEEAYLIIYCLNCIRCMQNSTFETGLNITTQIF